MSEIAGTRLTVVSAGLGEPSSSRLLADRLATATSRELAARGALTTVSFVDLRAHAQAIASALVDGFAAGELDKALTTLADADGAVLVTPIFNTSYSGLFKSFFDVCDPQTLSGLPVLLGATGGSERHSLALDYAIRPLLTYLHAVPVPTAVYAATSDWGATTGADATSDLARRVDRAAGELAREMLRPDRHAVRRAPDAFALPPGFDPSGVGTS